MPLLIKKYFILLVPYSKDHNNFHWHWYCFARDLFAGTDIDSGGGGGVGGRESRGAPYNGLYAKTPPERGISFRLEVYTRVGISRAGV